MQRDTVIFNFRKGFPALKEGFESIGFQVMENEWAPDDELTAHTEACVVNLYEAVRKPWLTLGLKRRLRPLDIYASHTLQPTWAFAPVKIYSPNAVWVRNFNLHGHSLEEMRSFCDHGGTLSWSLPERCYGVPARGGFPTHQRMPARGRRFDPATEWAGFTDLDDCVEKIRYRLAHFEESRRIAEAAHARVMRDHTYEHRARNLIAVARQVRAGGKSDQALSSDTESR